jgi:hypothetical protein
MAEPPSCCGGRLRSSLYEGNLGKPQDACWRLSRSLGVAVGSKTWYASYRDEKGKKQSAKLGSAQVLTVAQAREKARDTSARVLRGENVKKEKRSEKLTLGEFINNVFSPERKPSKHTLWRLNKQFKDMFYSSPIL